MYLLAAIWIVKAGRALRGAKDEMLLALNSWSAVTHVLTEKTAGNKKQAREEMGVNGDRKSQRCVH